MNAVVKLDSVRATPVADKYARALDHASEVSDPYRPSPLIPVPELDQIDAELQVAAKKATSKEASVAAALILGLFRRTDLQDPEIYAKHLLTELSEYPGSILPEVVRTIRRGHKFFPAVAEIVEAAEAAMAPIRSRQYSIALHRHEHRRREAYRLEQEACEARRIAERDARHARMVAVYGADRMPPPEALDQANQALFRCVDMRERAALEPAIDAGQQWALDVLRWLSVIGLAWPLIDSGDDCPDCRLSPQQAIDLIEHAKTDRDGAIQFVEGAIRGDVECIPGEAQHVGDVRRAVADAFAAARGHVTKARPAAAIGAARDLRPIGDLVDEWLAGGAKGES